MRYDTKKKDYVMKKSVIAVLGLVGLNASAAMILGFGAEADYYAPTASGDFNYKSTMTSFVNDRASAYQLGAYFEHPVPVVPNIRLDYTPEMEFSGSGNEVSFNQLDVTPYYEILDNIVDIDVGISLKVLDGKIDGVIDDSFSQVIPMGYVGAAAMLPGIPLSFSGSVKYIGYDGDSFSDSRIKAVWQVAAGLQAQVGYRYEKLDVSDRFDTTSNVTIKGPFVGIGYSF